MRFANKPSVVAGSARGEDIDPAFFADNRVPASLVDNVAKRAFDIAAATVGLILLSPTFLLASIAIKLVSRGPVFCSQMVYGYGNENISVLKFRTTAASKAGKDISVPTHIGRFFRQTGIEGLPQLVNVLRGEMSIVGPSPFIAIPDEAFAEQISPVPEPHRMKPGMTGWAQVNGCESNKVTGQRLECDRYYIENWSVSLDIKIILMTLFSKRAYLS
jgi:lipopolysaccharide/colanic/teichoic acid biosynthesis glycosyltransferase